MSRTWTRVPGLRGLLDWTCGCVCHEQERILVSFGVDLLCSAAVGPVDNFPYCACVCLLIWFRVLIWYCLLLQKMCVVQIKPYQQSVRVGSSNYHALHAIV
jgi:hypothetical protein